MNSEIQTRNTMSAVNEDNNNGLHSDVVTTGQTDVANDRDLTTSGAVLEDNVIFQTKSKQAVISSSTETTVAPSVAIIQEQTSATTSMS